MAERSRMPGLRQAEPRAALSTPLARLFRLHPGGAVSVAQLDPLRAAIQAAVVSLDGLRYAADDAVSDDPLVSTEALRMDIARHGGELAEHLSDAVTELELLATAIREGAAYVA